MGYPVSPYVMRFAIRLEWNLMILKSGRRQFTLGGENIFKMLQQSRDICIVSGGSGVVSLMLHQIYLYDIPLNV
jgi:hypothetical protein